MIRSNRTPTVFALAAALALGVWGCKARPDGYRIALAVPLTGDLGALGQGIKRAVELAIEEKTTSGGLLFPVALAAYDDRADPKEAVSVANRIASDRSVIGVIGHFNSGCSIPAAAVYARAGLVMISPAASNPQLTLQQLSPQWRWPRVVFRVNTTDDVQGSFGAEFTFKKLAARSVCVIHDKTAYGQGIAEEYVKRFEGLGGKVISFDGIQQGDKDFKAFLTRIKSLKPEALYFGGMFSEGGLLVRQARELGLKVPFVTDEANYDPEFLKIAGAAAEGSYVTFLGKPPDLMDTAKDFVERYRKRYPGSELKAYDHYGYEAASIFVEALEKVGPDRAKVIEYVRGVRRVGVLGETSFDEKGDTLNKTISLFTVKDGRFVPLE